MPWKCYTSDGRLLMHWRYLVWQPLLKSTMRKSTSEDFPWTSGSPQIRIQTRHHLQLRLLHILPHLQSWRVKKNPTLHQDLLLQEQVLQSLRRWKREEEKRRSSECPTNLHCHLSLGQLPLSPPENPTEGSVPEYPINLEHPLSLQPSHLILPQ